MGDERSFRSEHWRRGLKLGNPNRKGSKVHNARAGLRLRALPRPPSAGSTIEVVAEELGPSLRWATATTTRTTRSQ